MSVMELQTNIMTSSSYFLSTIFSSNERLASDKSPASARRGSRDVMKELHSATFYLDPPKWPVECQVLPQKIFHMFTTPSKPEPFYVSSGTEPQPRPVGEEMGKVIYDYQPKLSVDYYCHSTTSVGTEVLQTFETDENTLRFESRFECGNLSKVIKITNVYYELYLRPDMYTERHSQWYYFRIQNMKEGVLYRFSIVNLNKPESLYRYGLKPLMYSEKNAQLNGIGWVRCGKNISYFKNDLTSDENGSYYTLTFNLKFKHNDDTVYIAHCYPYTYTNLQNHLKRIEMDRFKLSVCQTRLLCRTLGGNNVYIMTISSPEAITADEDDEANKKPVVFLTARVHPGETPSSYMMKEIIDFLTSDCPQAESLRDRFIFKLIPMLNPDGVIIGNSRCCLLGQDLNRQYGTVLREAFPQIYHTKVILRRLAEENRLFLYCDIHGHSRKNNAFIYGCENRKMSERKLTEQVFPLMMHKNSSDKFSFQSCKFKVQKSKEGTGRLFVWTLGVTNSYTIELSLGGSTLSSRQQTHFHIGDYEGLGRHFCETLLDYSDPLKEPMKERILQKLIDKGSTADEPVNVAISDYSSLSHSESENEQQPDDVIEEGTDEKTPVVATTIKRQPSVRLKTKHARSNRKLKMVLNVSKASVEFIGLGRKQKSLVDDDDDDDGPNSSIKHIEAGNYGAGTRPHRLRRQESIMAAMERKRILQSGSSLRKYSKVVFDDPFNAPDSNATLTIRRSTKKRGSIHQKSYDAEMPQSEDECDQTVHSEKLVEQLTYQISNMRLTKSSVRNETEPPQIKIKSPVTARVDSNRKYVKRFKSQRVDELSPSASMHRLSVPKPSHQHNQQRRVSWSGASSLAIPSSTSSISSDSSLSYRRASVQRIGESAKATKLIIRKSVSTGGSRTASIEEMKPNPESESVLTEIKTTAAVSSSTVSATTMRRRKLQHTKKHRSQKK